VAGVGQGEGSTEHIPVAPVEGEEVEECKWEEQVEGGLQKQAPLACWKGFCESAPFLRGIPLQNGLAVCTHSKTDLDSSLPNGQACCTACISSPQSGCLEVVHVSPSPQPSIYLCPSHKLRVEMGPS